MSKKSKRIHQLDNILEKRDKLADEIFKMFAREENEDTIYVSDINNILNSMGREEKELEVEKYLRKNKIPEKSIMTKEEFQSMLNELYSYPEEELEKVIEAFQAFDYKNTGNVTKEQLKNILTKYSKEFTEEDFEELIKMIDPNETGIIDYKEFVNEWKLQ